MGSNGKPRPWKFLSTPSARRATEEIYKYKGQKAISIHALREEGDSKAHKPSRQRPYFYPRPPRGGRQAYTVEEAKAIIISIHALREEGDTGECNQCTKAQNISIHALREEGDRPSTSVLRT